MKQLFRGTWAELDQGVRIFLLTGTERALVIDTGMSGLDIHALISEHTDLTCMLLNTHADRDHVAGNRQFEEFYMHASEAALYRNAQKGSSRLIPVFDGDVIDLGERELEIVHLPGHTPGSVTVLDRKNRCLIGGDPIQEDGDIYMFGPHRDMDACIASLERLQLRDDFDVIYPSHAKERIDRSVIPRLIDGARRIVNGEIEGSDRVVHGNVISSFDVGAARFLCERIPTGN